MSIWGQEDDDEPTMASYYADPCSSLDEELREERAPGTWKTKAGEVVEISEMGDSHLLNTIRMLRRNGNVSVADQRFYLYGPRPQGEMAMEAFESEFDEVMDSPAMPVLDELEAEARKRGLR